VKLSIVSYLDPLTSAKVRQLQRDLSAVTGSVAALSSWEPHVTVADGVEVNREELAVLQSEVENLTAHINPFELELREVSSLTSWKGGSGDNATPYVIYLDVKPNKALLNLVEDFDIITSKFDKWYKMPRPYTPHCTLAFQDLSREGFQRGLEYLKNTKIELTTELDHVALVEKLTGANRELSRFIFSCLKT
jgi:2'-5' RNA ligase